MKNEDELLKIIQNDHWMLTVLDLVEKLNLPDCWVCAGFIRNKVWDTLHGYSERTVLNDIDVIYYDIKNLSEQEEKRIEELLYKMAPKEPWSVKNQARMHKKNQFLPYKSTYDGIAHFPEVPTAIGARLNKGQLEIIAPYGIDALFSEIVEPTPYFKQSESLYQVYLERVKIKNWKQKWPRLQIIK